jgi:enterochelin esterase-like enzyme/uncharacterized membrane protein
VKRLSAALGFAGPVGPYVPPPSGRDLRIDLLRGFCVVAMVIDHLAGPSYFYAITGGNRFYTSAAEAFIFISGLVMGLVYRRLIARDGLGPSLRRAIERAVALYLLTITLSLLFIPVSEVLNLHWAQGLDFQDPAAFVVSILSLHQTYYLVDIPLLYTLLIIVAPLALILLSQGRTAAVLGASWLLWLAYQLFPEQTDVPWTIAGNYLFYLSAWQVFFFTGMVLGWHREALARRLAKFPRRPALVASGLLFAALIVLYRLQDQLARLWTNDPQRIADVQLFLLEDVFGKSDVRPGRIVASIVVFSFFYLLVTEFWRPIHRLLGWLLLPLGESALYAYAAHVALAVPLALLLDRLNVAERYVRPLNTVIQIGALLLIWGLVRGKLLAVNPSGGWARYAWPASATLACLLLLPLDPTPNTPGLASAAPVDATQARVARAFGTPVPGKLPRGEPTPVPLPRQNLRQPAARANADQRGAPQVSPYVGPIRGTLRNLKFFSPALNGDMPYYIYLPPGYETEDRRYPVLYMLHGNSGSYEEWLAYGLVDVADRMIATRQILPLIIVLPQGDYSYWVNWPDEGPRYGNYLTVDLVRHITSTYRVLPGARSRAVGGLSMGGTGALINAFRFPNAWGVVGAHSPGLPEDGERDMLGEGADYRERDPITLAATAPGIENLDIWIDIGDQDSWLPRTEQLHEVLEARGVDHQFNVFPGGHDGDYWSSHIPDYLRFYDQALNPGQRP